MTASDASFDSRLEQAKLDAMKELAYGASHEINNPLANISARAQSLLRDERDPERRRTIEAINQQALRAHEMISDLMLFARPPQLVLAATNLADVVNEAARGLVPEMQRRNIALRFDGSTPLPQIQADATQLQVAIRALLDNALDAIGRDGAIDVTLSSTEAAVQLQIADTGPGIAPEVRPHIFDPFYSGREAGRGLGFGLSKAWRIVTLHNGTLEADSPSTGGATFTITLPQ
ncbi:sensor histidine kinase [Lacipirellula sp.]|uniref:sensor histidine kinase n=1 Tax=Lacipirellula sp. TaxID=2691419 RepID=UPI003D10513C